MFEKIFGSNTDWISQHSVFPDYFRQLFYATGNIFPQFAPNIGGGQNIYNFAYYGLYNPLLLPSWLFPFIKMSDYLIAVSILCLIADAVLMFRWLRSNHISCHLCTGVTLLFLLASPMIFHSYTHIMFVNYMPFLILGLIGIDRYFLKKKAGLLTFCIFLMIMTSFYFSIGGCLVLAIYGIYKYPGINEKNRPFTIRSIFSDGIRFCIPFFIGISMSCVLLVPTAMALADCKRQAGEVFTFAELFLPDLKWSQLFYNPYGTGVTTLFLTALFTGITFKKRHEKYICSICLIILMLPVFRFVLNGGLYIRGKVLIPFLPLLCYILALYLEKIKAHELSRIQLLLPAIITGALILAGFREEKSLFAALVLTDAALMFVCILLFYRKACEKILLSLSVILLLLCGIKENILSGNMVDRNFYQQITDEKYKRAAREIQNQEQGFYRMEENGSVDENAADINRVLSSGQYLSSVYSSTFHTGYQDFRKNTFQLEQPYRNILCQAIPENPVFRKLMGIKYIISDSTVPGYEKISDCVYENREVYPVAYVTSHLISQADYEKLSFPYNQLAFLKYSVSEKARSPLNWREDLENCVEQLNTGLKEKYIHADHITSEKLSIPRAEKGDVFFLQFDVENQQTDKDVSVYLENIRNKLSARDHLYYNKNTTFTYAAALEEGQTELNLQFGSGTYSIRNIKAFLYQNKLKPAYTEFHIDHKLTSGNKIAGYTEGNEDGYLVTSIPFDKNFEIRVDGKRVSPEKVNTAFLGIELKKGRHVIEFTYHAKGFQTGFVISLSGWFFILLSGILSRNIFPRRRAVPASFH